MTGRVVPSAEAVRVGPEQNHPVRGLPRFIGEDPAVTLVVLMLSSRTTVPLDALSTATSVGPNWLGSARLVYAHVPSGLNPTIWWSQVRHFSLAEPVSLTREQLPESVTFVTSATRPPSGDQAVTLEKEGHAAFHAVEAFEVTGEAAATYSLKSASTSVPIGPSPRIGCPAPHTQDASKPREVACSRGIASEARGRDADWCLQCSAHPRLVVGDWLDQECTPAPSHPGQHQRAALIAA
ncbi:hypothetical protein BH24ACT11_BH24ACT11_11690 [soil metagenome]